MSLDVPALERLFKDDKELEIQLKQGVIVNFVDRYMKSLLKDEFLMAQIVDIKNKIQQSVSSIVGEQVGKVKKDCYGYGTIKLNAEIESQIGLHARAAVADSVQKFVHERIEQYLTTKELDKYIERSVAYKLSELTKAEVQKRVDKIMKGA